MSLINQSKVLSGDFIQDFEVSGFSVDAFDVLDTVNVSFDTTLCSNEFASSSTNEVNILSSGRYRIYFKFFCTSLNMSVTKNSGGLASIALKAGSSIVGGLSLDRLGATSLNTFKYSKSFIFNQLSGSAYGQANFVKTSFTSVWNAQYSGKITSFGDYELIAGDKIYLEGSVAPNNSATGLSLSGSGQLIVQKLL